MCADLPLHLGDLDHRLLRTAESAVIMPLSLAMPITIARAPVLETLLFVIGRVADANRLMGEPMQSAFCECFNAACATSP